MSSVSLSRSSLLHEQIEPIEQSSVCPQETRSNASAIPCPPPMQSVTIPLLIPSRCIECNRRVVSTAPLAPIGCPCAIAPPSTLTTSGDKPRSFVTAIAMAAKASLISIRWISAVFQPARSSAWQSGERAEHRNKPHDKNSDAQGPLPCPLKTPPAGKDDERHRAEINEIERV